MTLSTPFIPLRVQTEYSLGASTIRTKKLAEYCRVNRIPAVGISDKDNMFGVLEFAIACAANGVQPICGCDIMVRHEGVEGRVLLFAKSECGYKRLLNILSTMYTREKPRVSQPVIELEELCGSCGDMIALHGAPGSLLCSLIEKGCESGSFLLKRMMQSGCDVFIELQRYEDGRHKAVEPSLMQLAYEFKIPLVATNCVQFFDKDMHEACDSLSCIVNGQYLAAEDRIKICDEHYMKNEDYMRALFRDLPEAINNTSLIARKCGFLLQPSQPKLPHFCVDQNEDDMIESYTRSGLENRLKHIFDGEVLDQYWERLRFELSVIKRMQFSGYFLIVSDFIKWSKEQNIPVGPGRGSGAGSVVAWALEITEVDPIKFGLLFERFLNPERVSMPDFDIDFCQTRRDEVIQYVARKYGQESVAHIITFGRLQARAVLRDVGRVLQVPYGLVDKICKMVPNNPANPVTLQQAIDMDAQLKEMRNDEPEIDRMLSIALQLEGLVRHSSIHAAGVVISDQKLSNVAPLYLAQDSETVAIQFSMKLAEAAGLIKFDFLGLKTLTVLQQAIEIIAKEYGKQINLNELHFSDSKTYEMLSQGKTVGVFQFEGVGVTEAMKKLQPSAINDLIALASLYRPGPMGHIKNYINRKHGYEEIEYIHPKLEAALEETYGIIVYQEQVMEIFKLLGGYSLAEADIVRRAMGKKNKEEMKAQRETFVERSVKNGLASKAAQEIFDLVDKFAGYGFNKSHGTAYGIISYHTAYIKAHYAHAFFVASINLEIDDSDKVALFCMDARYEFQIDVLPPCINKSDAYFKVEHVSEKDDAIRFGLAAIKGVGIKVVEFIVAERDNNGAFLSLQDFVDRSHKCGLNKRIMENLLRSGAFVDIHINTADAMKEIVDLLHCADADRGDARIKQISLMDMMMIEDMPKEEVAPWSFSERLSAEYAALGFYLTEHPLSPYDDALAMCGVVHLNSVMEMLSENMMQFKVAGVVMSRKIRSGNSGKYAFIRISDQFGSLDFSIFDEELLLQKVDLIEEGKVVFCMLSGKMDDSGTRIIADDILSVDEVMKKYAFRYVISIAKNDEISKVKRVIKQKDRGDDGEFPVALMANVDGGKVKLAANRRYWISVDDAQELRGRWRVHIKGMIERYG